MEIGSNLKKLRTSKNMTQKELADQLHVSSQAVSRWENDEVEPDISTLSKLSSIFDVSIDAIINGQINTKEEKVEEEKKEVEIQKTPKKLLGKCESCGKDIYEGDNYKLDTKESYTTRKRGHKVYHPGYTHYYCDSCRYKAITSTPSTSTKTSRKNHSFGKKRLGFGITFGLLTLVGSMIALFLCTQINPAGIIALSILFGYIVLATIYCIFTDCYIFEMFADIASFSIKMPGVIFTLDFDGIVFLIVTKITLSILSFLLTAAVIAFGITLSAFLSFFTFPFVINKEAI